MSNHCTLVICKSCGAIYCARCGRSESLPDAENIVYHADSFKVHVDSQVCNHCSSNTLYIY